MSILDVINNTLSDYKSAISGGSSSSGQTTGTTNTSSSDAASTEGSYGPAYVIDISKAAQQILDQDRASGVANQFGGNITLSDVQQQKIQEILDKYKNSPLTDEVITSIDADLQAAGLAPDQLAKIQEAKEFNPEQVFLQMITGDSGDSGGVASLIGSNSSESSLIPSVNDLLSFSKQYPSSAAVAALDQPGNDVSDLIV